MITIRKIIAGKQSGAQRAALDFAEHHNIEHGGVDSRLAHADHDEPSNNTHRNVDDSDATLIVLPAHVESRATQATIAYWDDFMKPYLVTDGRNQESLMRWFDSMEELHPNLILNVTGPRHGESVKTYDLTYEVLSSILTAS